MEIWQERQTGSVERRTDGRRARRHRRRRRWKHRGCGVSAEMKSGRGSRGFGEMGWSLRVIRWEGSWMCWQRGRRPEGWLMAQDDSVGVGEGEASGTRGEGGSWKERICRHLGRRRPEEWLMAREGEGSGGSTGGTWEGWGCRQEGAATWEGSVSHTMSKGQGGVSGGLVRRPGKGFGVRGRRREKSCRWRWGEEGGKALEREMVLMSGRRREKGCHWWWGRIFVGAGDGVRDQRALNPLILY